MTTGHRWNSVGDEYVRFLVAAYQNNGEVHWPTVVAATSGLCGEMALMANETSLPEFGFIDSRKVSEFIHNSGVKHKTIWGYSLMIAREAFSVEVEDLPDYQEVTGMLGTQLLPGDFPRLTVPAHLMPRETPLNAGPTHRKTVNDIASNAGLNMRDTSFALATAAMKMVGHGAQLGAKDLTVLALQCCVAGSRFVPLYEPARNPAMGSIVDMMPRSEDDDVTPKTNGDGVSMLASAAVAAALAPDEATQFGKRR